MNPTNEQIAEKYCAVIGLRTVQRCMEGAIEEATAPLQREIEELKKYKSVTELAADNSNLAEYLAQLEQQLSEAEKDKKRLDWLEKQQTIALWQGSFSDSPYNQYLHRVGGPICTLSTMEPDGRESNDDEIGSGQTFRQAIDSAMKETKP